LRTRKEPRQAELHRPEQPAVVVVVDRAPAAPVVLDLLDPAPLVGLTLATRLPPDAVVADARRHLEGRAREADDLCAHLDSITRVVAPARSPPAAPRSGTERMSSRDRRRRASRRRACGRGRACTARSGARSGTCRPGRAGRSARRACGR